MHPALKHERDSTPAAVQVAAVVTAQSLQSCPSAASGLVSGACVHPALWQERDSTPAAVQVAAVVTAQSLQSCPSAASSTILHTVQTCAAVQVAGAPGVWASIAVSTSPHNVQTCAASHVATGPGMWVSCATGLVSDSAHPALVQVRVSTPAAAQVGAVVTDHAPNA